MSPNFIEVRSKVSGKIRRKRINPSNKNREGKGLFTGAGREGNQGESFVAPLVSQGSMKEQGIGALVLKGINLKGLAEKGRVPPSGGALFGGGGYSSGPSAGSSG